MGSRHNCKQTVTRPRYGRLPSLEPVSYGDVCRPKVFDDRFFINYLNVHSETTNVSCRKCGIQRKYRYSSTLASTVPPLAEQKFTGMWPECKKPTQLVSDLRVYVNQDSREQLQPKRKSFLYSHHFLIDYIS